MRIRTFLSVVVLLAVAAGCASTSIRDSWAVDDIATRSPFDKILVMYIDPTEGTRRDAEDALVSRLGGGRAVASYSLFSAQDLQNAEGNQSQIADRLRSEGFDGAVVMRVVDEDQELSYSPGMTYPAYYGGFYDFYGYGWGMASTPGYMRTNTIVSVETNVYDLNDDDLVWAGVTQTTNPSQIAGMVNEIADAVEKNLRDRGLID